MLYYFERMGPSYSPVGYMICYRGEMKNGKRNGQGTTFEKYNTENTYYEPGVYRDNHLTRSVGYAVYDDNNELIKMGNAVDPVYLDEEKQKEYLKNEEYMTIDLGNPTYSRDQSSRSKQRAAAAAKGLLVVGAALLTGKLLYYSALSGYSPTSERDQQSLSQQILSAFFSPSQRIRGIGNEGTARQCGSRTRQCGSCGHGRRFRRIGRSGLGHSRRYYRQRDPACRDSSSRIGGSEEAPPPGSII